MKYPKTIEDYINKGGDWKESLLFLRELISGSGLVETVKWGAPVYTLNDKNVVGLAAFKKYTAIWFFQGALLKDRQKKLVNAQEGVTKALRQWRFENIEDIRDSAELIDQYVKEALENQKNEIEIKAVKNKPLIIPDGLKGKLEADNKLKAAFDKFTVAKQREFAEYISEAKRIDTKQKRIDNIIPMILEGMDLNSKYRK